MESDAYLILLWFLSHNYPMYIFIAFIGISSSFTQFIDVSSSLLNSFSVARNIISRLTAMENTEANTEYMKIVSSSRILPLYEPP